MAIEFGRHLVVDQKGWQLRFPGEETKTRVEIDVAFPNGLVGGLEDYLQIYRPLLAGDRYHGPRLWVTY